MATIKNLMISLINSQGFINPVRAPQVLQRLPC